MTENEYKQILKAINEKSFVIAVHQVNPCKRIMSFNIINDKNLMTNWNEFFSEELCIKTDKNGNLIVKGVGMEMVFYVMSRLNGIMKEYSKIDSDYDYGNSFKTIIV